MVNLTVAELYSAALRHGCDIQDDDVEIPQPLWEQDPELAETISEGATLLIAYASAAAAGLCNDAPGVKPPFSPPTIIITTEEMRIADEAIASLAAKGGVYRRGQMLVELAGDDTGRKVIRPIVKARLRELLADSVRWRILRKRGEEYVECDAPPPTWCVDAILARPEWPELPKLDRVVHGPAMSPDWRVIQQPGFDEASGIFCDLFGEWPAVADTPTRDEVKTAVELLADVVSDFPFESDLHRAAWFGYLFTLIGRSLIDGPSPMFACDASRRGSGKGLSVDVAAIIATGRRAATTTMPRESDECRKVITAVAIEGRELVAFDNVLGRVGCGPLDEALTSTLWTDRVLGSSATTGELPLLVAWSVTGNQLQFGADTARRVYHCRLVPNCEHPEDRSDFKYPNLRMYVAQHRRELLTAVLTILRGYAAAGRPSPDVSAWGSYDEWSAVVRGACVWAGIGDPAATRFVVRDQHDESGELLRIIFAAMEEATNDAGEVTVKELVSMGDDDHPAVQRLMEYLTTDKGPPTTRVIGRRLRDARQAIVSNMQLLSRDTRLGLVWRVECGTAVQEVQDPPDYTREGSLLDAYKTRGLAVPPVPPVPQTPPDQRPGTGRARPAGLGQSENRQVANRLGQGYWPADQG